MSTIIKVIVVAGLCLPTLSCVPSEATRRNVNIKQTDDRPTPLGESSVQAASCSNVENPADVQVQEFSGEGFTLLHPPAVRIARKLRLTEFEIYTFTYQEEEILSLYVGNLPEMGIYGLPIISDCSHGTINGLPYEQRRVFSIDGPARTQVTIESTDGRLWPAFLSFRYKNGSSDIEEIVKQIIQSVKSREAGTLPNPSLETTDPTRFTRLMIQYWERVLTKLKEFQGTDVNPFPESQGDPKERLELAIRRVEERIRECEEQVTLR